MNYYLDIAQTVAERSTCLRRCYGAILVKDDEIVSTGYNGAPRGRKNCADLGRCTREELGIPSGERYELCRSVHAEANCIISAARRESLGGTIYLACLDPQSGELMAGTSSCAMCRRLIINAGIAQVVIRDTPTDYRVVHVEDWIREDDSLAEKQKA
jgi:dCMP deaminase